MFPIARIVPPLPEPSVVSVTPIHFFGDSNVLAFRHLHVELPLFFARPIATVACFLPHIAAGTFASDGDHYARFLAYLRNEAILKPLELFDEFVAVPQSAIRRELDAGLRPPVHDVWNLPYASTLVLVLGSLDVLAIVSEMGPAYDFFCDDPLFEPAAFPESDLPMLPSAVLEDLIESRTAGLVSALQGLRALGIFASTRVYIHSIHPPTLDDVTYYRHRGIVCSASVRYKVTLALNRRLRQIASRAGARFLDLWGATTKDGVLDPELSLDGDHLNRAGAIVTLRELLADLVVERARPLP